MLLFYKLFWGVRPVYYKIIDNFCITALTRQQQKIAEGRKNLQESQGILENNKKCNNYLTELSMANTA
jgi:hypothetical protein